MPDGWKKKEKMESERTGKANIVGTSELMKENEEKVRSCDADKETGKDCR